MSTCTTVMISLHPHLPLYMHHCDDLPTPPPASLHEPLWWSPYTPTCLSTCITVMISLHPHLPLYLHHCDDLPTPHLPLYMHHCDDLPTSPPTSLHAPLWWSPYIPTCLSTCITVMISTSPPTSLHASLWWSPYIPTYLSTCTTMMISLYLHLPLYMHHCDDLPTSPPASLHAPLWWSPYIPTCLSTCITVMISLYPHLPLYMHHCDDPYIPHLPLYMHHCDDLPTSPPASLHAPLWWSLYPQPTSLHILWRSLYLYYLSTCSVIIPTPPPTSLHVRGSACLSTVWLSNVMVGGSQYLDYWTPCYNENTQQTNLIIQILITPHWHMAWNNH